MKLKSTFAIVAICFLLSVGLAKAQTDSLTITPSRLAAAKQLILTTGMTDVRFTAMRDNTLKALSASIPAKNKEKLTVGLKEFFNKYLPADRFREQFAHMYAQLFTEDELNQLIKFYNSPLGKKVASKVPEVLQKAMLMDQQILTEHTAGLEAIVEESSKE